MKKYAGRWVGASAVSLDLHADGTFAAAQLPIQLAGPAFWSAPLTGTGTWTVYPPMGALAESVTLELSDHGAVTLKPRGSELVLPTGDVRNEVVLHRR